MLANIHVSKRRMIAIPLPLHLHLTIDWQGGAPCEHPQILIVSRVLLARGDHRAQSLQGQANKVKAANTSLAAFYRGLTDLADVPRKPTKSLDMMFLSRSMFAEFWTKTLGTLTPKRVKLDDMIAVETP
jgi:hypothetical protein